MVTRKPLDDVSPDIELVVPTVKGDVHVLIEAKHRERYQRAEDFFFGRGKEMDHLDLEAFVYELQRLNPRATSTEPGNVRFVDRAATIHERSQAEPSSPAKVPAERRRGLSPPVVNRDQRPARAEKMLRLAELVIPQRIANEEIGDALEMINRLCAGGAPPWQIWLKIASTYFWVGVHAVHEIICSAKQKRKT